MISNDLEKYDSFDDMELNSRLLRNIYAMGFERPSHIQSYGIVPITQHKDILAQSQSGTGKTGAFLIGTIQNIDPSIKHPQTLIIVPTRELAIQIHSIVEQLVKHMDIQYSLCVGGMDIDKNNREKIKSQIIVGTPGRINKLIEINLLITTNIHMLVLDEMDELLSDDFSAQMKSIIDRLSYDTQKIFFSATLKEQTQKICDILMKDNYSKILLNSDEITLDGINQFFINVIHDNQKLDTLIDLYAKISISQSIIYVNTIKRGEWLHNRLIERGHAVSLIHSNFKLQDRKRILSSFARGETRVLISTDLLARGIDIQQISVVINYDIPFDIENYIHRIGRSGRFGRKGCGINFVTMNDIDQIKKIEQFYDTEIKPFREDDI